MAQECAQAGCGNHGVIGYDSFVDSERGVSGQKGLLPQGDGGGGLGCHLAGYHPYHLGQWGDTKVDIK